MPTITSFPIETREISSDFSGFLSDIGARSVPVSVAANDQTLSALAGNTYQIIAGTGTSVIFNDPTTGITNGDYYKVLLAGGTSVTIGGSGGTVFSNVSPIEILRIYNNSAWSTISGLAAAQITSGTFDVARIPSLSADKITSGTFDVARIPSLSADKITSGTFDAARIPALSADKITSGTFDAARIPNLDASKITSGIIDAARLPSYVDDVLEFANVAAFPVTGEISKIYIALDTNATYRWSGSVYIQINSDQTITLTSDVTGSGTGSFATTISAGAVSLSKMANVASSTVFYRKTAGSGAPEVQSLATLKTDLGLTGTNSGDQDLSGLVTKLTPSEYTVTNGPTVPVKTFNASTATIDDVYNVLATLIQTLKDRQII
jgi:hypothetical protein